MRIDRLFPAMALAMALSGCGDRAAEDAAVPPQASTVRVTGFDGLVVVPATGTVPVVADRLKAAIENKGLMFVTRVDHQANATAVGLSMRPATVLIFGSPKVGTPVMAAAPTAALDLPQRMLVFQDVDGATKIAYNDPGTFARQHGVVGQVEAVQAMTEALAGLAAAAATS